MHPELLNVLTPGMATVAELMVFLYLYRDHREPFLWWWNLGWAWYAGEWVWRVLAVATGNTVLWYPFSALCGALAVGCACMSGVTLYRPYRLRVIDGVCLLLYGTLALLSASPLNPWQIGRLFVPLSVGLAYLGSGLLFLPPRSQPAMQGVKLLAGAQMLRGLPWLLCLFVLQPGDLTPAPILAIGAVFHLLAVIGMIMLVLERSKQRALELHSRLEQAERLAALGELSAGVAHEIRNPLGAIVNAVQAIGAPDMELEGAEKALLVQVVQQEAARLNRLLTDFVQFTRPTRPQPLLGDLNTLLGEIAALLRRDAAAAGMRIRAELAASLPAVRFDPDQLRQAVWNLAKNGLESMKAGQEFVLASQAGPGEACILIQDSGDGIAATELPHIFRPFYSHKAGGTGLGLAIAARIVQAHAGTIDVKSCPGTGTTVIIRLPIATEAAHHGADSACR